jgi:hypothetical protein
MSWTIDAPDGEYAGRYVSAKMEACYSGGVIINCVSNPELVAKHLLAQVYDANASRDRGENQRFPRSASSPAQCPFTAPAWRAAQQ